VRDHWQEFEKLGAAALVISFAQSEELARFRNHLKLPFPITADPEQLAYRDYDLGKGSTWQVWHPKTVLKYLGYAASGKKIERPEKGEDLNQLGGDFVIDAQGILRYAFRSQRPDHRPPINELTTALAKITHD